MVFIQKTKAPGSLKLILFTIYFKLAQVQTKDNCRKKHNLYHYYRISVIIYNNYM